METQQNENTQNVLDLTDSLIAMNNELQKIKEEEEPSWEYTSWEVTKSVIKCSIIAAMIAVLLDVVIISIRCLATDIVQNPEDLKSRLTLNVLGRIPSASTRAKVLDRLAATVGGIRVKSANYKRIVGLTAQSICKIADEKQNGDNKFAVMGSISTKYLANITDEFNSAMPADRNCFVMVGNPMLDISSIEKIQDLDYVIIVEKQDLSTYKNIVNECERIRAWGKEILGIVLLDVDSI